MSNLLIVESKNDEFFVRTLIEHLNLSDVQVDAHPICQVDAFECMDGLNAKKLHIRLMALKNQFPKREINAIGIILDHDGKREERINLINETVHNVFVTKENILDTGRFVSASARIGEDEFHIRIACYLVNVDESGELETVLKAIKSADSPYADCLQAWRECVEAKKNVITPKDKARVLSDKEFDKFWLSNYIRFDTCSKKERKQADRKCSVRQLEYVMKNKKDIFDFDHPVLDDFKEFLRLFKS
ncbi:MAG: hypothetical protein B6245_05015 [Desulfobacteraceae bacterium 4572_88]|nr:MAG: hypothetical protein B6245_05015 [Desulfobacteraceae bacterium 4572_88]